MVRIHPDPPVSAVSYRQSALSKGGWARVGLLKAECGLPISGVREADEGAVAQLGERLLCKQEVIGSIPFSSTRKQAECRSKRRGLLLIFGSGRNIGCSLKKRKK
jgi:hypothetical protein